MWLWIYIISLKHNHILSILMLNFVFFIHAYLFVYNELNPSSSDDFFLDPEVLTSFVLWEIMMHQFFLWLLPIFPSNWNSKIFMNNNVMNWSNNYESIVTSTVSYNWLKGRLHILLHNPSFANRRRHSVSLAE